MRFSDFSRASRLDLLARSSIVIGGAIFSLYLNTVTGNYLHYMNNATNAEGRADSFHSTIAESNKWRAVADRERKKMFSYIVLNPFKREFFTD